MVKSLYAKFALFNYIYLLTILPENSKPLCSLLYNMRRDEVILL